MMLDNWFVLPIGILIASVVSTAGIGGGILWMPFLMIVLRLRPDMAVATSLLIQTAGMGSSTVAFWRQDRIDIPLMGILLLLTVPGIALGASLTRLIPASRLELILGILTLATALVFVSGNHDYADSGRKSAQLSLVRRWAWLVSTVSIASGMLSVSVGEGLIPLMRGKLGLRMNVAVATSVATIFGTCVLGAMLHLIMGDRADWTVFVWAVPGVLIGGQIGPHISARINDRALKEVFIFLLTLIGIHLIYNSN